MPIWSVVTTSAAVRAADESLRIAPPPCQVESDSNSNPPEPRTPSAGFARSACPPHAPLRAAEGRPSASLSDARDREELPPAGHALEHVRTAFLERDAGADHEILHRRGH